MPILVVCTMCNETMKFTYQKVSVCDRCADRIRAANESAGCEVFEEPGPAYVIQEQP